MQNGSKGGGQMGSNRNLRRISIVVTAQTVGSLAYLSKMCGYPELGMVVDKLTREKMVNLRTWSQVDRKGRKRGQGHG